VNNRFHFVSRWRIDAPVADVYLTLADLDELARFWPGFRARWTQSSGPVVGRAACFEIRGLLPVRLSFTVRIVAARPGQEISAVAEGDLAGWGTWRLESDGAGTLATLTWDVRLEHPRLKRLAGPLRPLFSWSHALAMRLGERGLRKRLASAGRPRRTWSTV
jgi:hypothetical protein